MSALEDAIISRGHADETKARVGLIIPSSNRMTEPQFHRYAPAGVAVHIARVQMTGRYKKPIAQLLDDIGRAASSLADARCNLIVFHCTGTAMAEGKEGEAALVRRVAQEGGVVAFSTAQAIVEALEQMGMRRVVLLSPYPQAVNDHEREFLAEHGIEVVRDVALNVGSSDEYIRVPVTRWFELAREHARVAADGYFLSCTNTTQIEAIEAIERETGKPASIPTRRRSGRRSSAFRHLAACRRSAGLAGCSPAWKQPSPKGSVARHGVALVYDFVMYGGRLPSVSSGSYLRALISP